MNLLKTLDLLVSPSVVGDESVVTGLVGEGVLQALLKCQLHTRHCYGGRGSVVERDGDWPCSHGADLPSGSVRRGRSIITKRLCQGCSLVVLTGSLRHRDLQDKILSSNLPKGTELGFEPNSVFWERRHDLAGTMYVQ